MKMILASLLLAAAPPWLTSTTAWACDCDDGAKKRVVVVTEGKVTTGDHHCVISGADEGTAKIVVKIGGDKNDGRSEDDEKFVWVSRKGSGKERGWLGVSIGNVPEALAAQLDLEDQGIIVLDVIDDSPADHAGLRVHDVILSVERDVVEGDVGKAVDLIKSRKPGDEVDIVVLRDGREKTITVELGSRSGVKELLKWTTDADIEERVKTRCKILRRGEDDEWIIENLGDLKALKELPKHIRMLIPESGSRSTKILVKGDKKKITTKVERDGTVIALTQEGDGPITVKRVDEDGNESEQTYADEDELREADEEAYELWEDVGDSVVVHLDLDSIEIPEIKIPHIEIPELDIDIPEFEFDLDSEDWQERMEEWGEEFGRNMQQWGEELGEKIRESDEDWGEQWGKHWGRHWGEQWGEHWGEIKERLSKGEGLPDDVEFPSVMTLRHLGKPKHTFEVQTDGTIEVRIRKGGSEIVQRFADEDDLAQRSPKLYKKYKILMALEDE